MRSIAGFFAARSRAGAALLVPLLAAGCSAEFWTGRPTVKTVEVSVAPKIIAEGQQAQATGVPRKDDGSQITSSKVKVTYASSDPTIATVSAQSGLVTAIAPGRVAIVGTSQGKTGTDTITVVQGDPSVITVLPNERLSLTVGASAPFTVDPRGANGQTLPNRTASFASNDTRVATVASTGPLAGRITAVALGTTQINVTIGSKTTAVEVVVRQAPPGSVTVALQTGKSEIQVREAQQVVPTVRDSAGNTLSTFGRQVVYQSSDVTVATVNSTSGVVTGIKQGTTELSVTVDNLATGKMTLTVIPQKVIDLKFRVANYTFRRGGAVLQIPAVAVDSGGRQVDRPVAYRSLDPTIATITEIGLITPRALGATKLVASIDNLTDTLTVQVTPLPITAVVVNPRNSETTIGQTRQFTVQLFDSLNVEVTGRPVEWLTNNFGVATVNQSGLATGVGPGSAQIQAVVDEVPGFPKQVAGGGTLVVRQIPIARLQVQPDSVNLRPGGRVAVIIRAFDAAGTELFNRTNTFIVRSSNSAVATGDATGNVVGVAEGKATLTYQAIDPATSLAQGTPATITVVVQPQTGGGDD